MAPSKKSPAASKTRSSSSSAPHIKKVKGENFYHNAKTVGRLKMLNGGKAVRDKDGRIVQAAAFQKGEDETKPGRVQPDRRWFGAFLPCSVLLEGGIYIARRKHEGDLPDRPGSLPHKSRGEAE